MNKKLFIFLLIMISLCSLTFAVDTENGTLSIVKSHLKEELRFGDDLSFLGTLYKNNTLLPVTNAKCSYDLIHIDTEGFPVVLTSNEFTSKTAGDLVFGFDTNNLNSKILNDMLNNEIYLYTYCECFNNSGDFDVPGTCMINDTRNTVYLFDDKLYVINTTSDNSYNIESSNLNIFLFPLVIIIMVLISYFIFNALSPQHTILKYILLTFNLVYLSIIGLYLPFMLSVYTNLGFISGLATSLQWVIYSLISIVLLYILGYIFYKNGKFEGLGL